MVIGIEPDIIQIIMFSSGSNAFLSIGSPAWHVRRLDLTQENWDELVHPRIGEQKVR